MKRFLSQNRNYSRLSPKCHNKFHSPPSCALFPRIPQSLRLCNGEKMALFNIEKVFPLCVSVLWGPERSVRPPTPFYSCIYVFIYLNKNSDEMKFIIRDLLLPQHPQREIFPSAGGKLSVTKRSMISPMEKLRDKRK